MYYQYFFFFKIYLAKIYCNVREFKLECMCLCNMIHVFSSERQDFYKLKAPIFFLHLNLFLKIVYNLIMEQFGSNLLLSPSCLIH